MSIDVSLDRLRALLRRNGTGSFKPPRSLASLAIACSIGLLSKRSREVNGVGTPCQGEYMLSILDETKKYTSSRTMIKNSESMKTQDRKRISGFTERN
jgi:hypothetical protein